MLVQDTKLFNWQSDLSLIQRKIGYFLITVIWQQCLMAGLTPEEVFLGTFGKATDPASGGRQLPVHWGCIKM
ncbi:MAG: hypothetical protein MZV64_07790 [Ignavibacteriales bacterium]|nr:hypothetical protein [Ignavibacteriales bacterium]